MQSHREDKKFCQGSLMSSSRKVANTEKSIPRAFCRLVKSAFAQFMFLLFFKKSRLVQSLSLGVRFLDLSPESQICGTCSPDRCTHPENSQLLTDLVVFFTTKVATISESMDKEGRASWHPVSFFGSGLSNRTFWDVRDVRYLRGPMQSPLAPQGREPLKRGSWDFSLI